MESSIIERTNESITPEMIDKVASSTGESPENTRKAIRGAFPTILAGLAHRASTAEGASSLTDTLKEDDAPEKIGGAGDARALAQEGEDLVGKIFGERSGSAAEALASHSGVKSSSASRILALAAPLIARAVGPDVFFGGSGGWLQTLSSRKAAILEHPDAPRGLAGVFGGEGEARPEASVPPKTDAARTPARDSTERPMAEVARRDLPVQGAARVKKIGSPRNDVERLEGRSDENNEVRAARRTHWGMVVALGAVGLLAWGIIASMRGHAPDLGVMEHQPTAPASAQPPPQPSAPAANGDPGIRLPNGSTLDVDPSSPEAALAHTLADPSAPIPRRFRFDELRFETGSSTVRPEAQKAIESLGMTLKAYPSSRVRVDGYTDNVGDEATNQSLSRARADAIKNAIVTRGIPADRIDTMASGPRPHVASNDSDQGRMQNRRSEIVLLSR